MLSILKFLSEVMISHVFSINVDNLMIWHLKIYTPLDTI